MKLRARELCDMGDKLFANRGQLMSLWQELADNFYPERADFTTSRSLGSEFASHLMSGAPVLARRELADQFGSMLRPKGKEWFSIVPDDMEMQEKRESKDFLDGIVKIQRAAMYDGAAMLTRATKEADNDFATFGQAVLTAELDLDRMTLIYRTHHLRDVAWSENDYGEKDYIHRKWKMQARNICSKYGSKVPAKIHELAKKEPFKELEVRHIVVPYDEYDYQPEKPVRNAGKFKFMSMIVLKDEDAVLSEKPVFDHQYIIPRWQTVSGSQYAHSPATVIALPDARLLQRITFTLLEAGEKATNPPMLAVQEAIRSDIALYAGGITWADSEYDERLGEVLRPLSMDKSGLSFGSEMADRYENMIKRAFFLDQIQLPPFDGAAMTATEIRARTEEYIRAALPLFEPLEAEYNEALCEKTFNILKWNGAFGSQNDWPEDMLSADLKWQFQSPLADAAGKTDAITFQESAQLLAQAAQIDPKLAAEWDIRSDFRKALRSLKASVVDEQSSEDAQAEAAMMEQLQQGIGLASAGGQAAAQMGKAVESFSTLQGVAA